MDERRLQTLELIEMYLPRLSYKDAGYQLILLANDYLQLQDHDKSYALLQKIDQKYFEKEFYEDIQRSKEFAVAVANLIEVFSLELSRSAIVKA